MKITKLINIMERLGAKSEPPQFVDNEEASLYYSLKGMADIVRKNSKRSGANIHDIANLAQRAIGLVSKVDHSGYFSNQELRKAKDLMKEFKAKAKKLGIKG